MNEDVRSRSPRSPASPLDIAVQRALEIYEHDGLHAVPMSVAAQHLGYKDAGSGPSRRALATLKVYGLVTYPAGSKLAVTKEVQQFKLAPSEEKRREFLIKWLRTPEVNAQFLDRYPDALPSEGAMVYAAVEMGFTEQAAKDYVADLKRSVEYVGYYMRPSVESSDREDEGEAGSQNPDRDPDKNEPRLSKNSNVSVDRIPIRLPGNRRAWLEVPVPFYESDKETIRRHLEVIVTDEDTEQ